MRWNAKRMSVLLCGMLLAGIACAGPEAGVSPAQQARRDADRMHILRTELDAEEQGLARAAGRRAERAAANDIQGVTEAEQALNEHRRNVQALRTEIERARAPAGVTTGPVKPRQRTDGRAPASKPERPWWDAYGSRPPPDAASAGAGGGTEETPAGGSSDWWNAYSGGARR